MLQKSLARKKSAARKSKSFPKGMAASWSTDDVYNLLKAVNEVTLKRMEDAINGNRRYIVDLHNKLVNDHLLPMRREIQAIKAKTDRLP